MGWFYAGFCCIWYFQTIIQGLILLRNYSILVFEEFKNQSSVVFLNLKKGWILQVRLMNFYPVIRDSIMLIPTCESCANSILTDGELKMPHETEYEFLWTLHLIFIKRIILSMERSYENNSGWLWKNSSKER